MRNSLYLSMVPTIRRGYPNHTINLHGSSFDKGQPPGGPALEYCESIVVLYLDPKVRVEAQSENLPQQSG